MNLYRLLVVVVCGLLGACSSDEPGTTIDASSVQLTEIPINGTTLNYMERGQGAPVLLVHGTLGDYRTWDGQIEALSRDRETLSCWSTVRLEIIERGMARLRPFPETIVSSPTAADIIIPMSGHRPHPAFPRSSMPKIWRRSFSV
jgi:hypothetical protein